MNTGKWIYGYTIVTLIVTLLLLVAGALVTGTGSSLSVPDWPLSFGQLMPPMVGGVFYEHGHRLIAGSVALLTIGLAILLKRSKRPYATLGLVAVAAVLIQALLGGLTVLLRLPPVVSVAHACLAQIFFSLIAVIAWLSFPRRKRLLTEQENQASLMGHSQFVVVLFFTQLFLGAWMRHMGAGLAIPDFPTSFGLWLPPFEELPVVIHFLHRLGALAIFLSVLSLTVRIYRSEQVQDIFWVGSLMTLVMIQGFLGALTIWLARPIWLTTLHLVIGASCFAIAVVLSVSLSERSAAGVEGDHLATA